MKSTPWLQEGRDWDSLAIGVAIALVLWGLSYFLLKKTERAASRLGLVFLMLYIGMLLLDWGVPAKLEMNRGFQILENFFLFASLGRSALLVMIHGLWRPAFGKLPPRIVLDLLQGAVFISIALLALDSSGVKPTSLLATSAVLTAVLGLSLQETLGNLFAGLAIQGEQPFQVGDWIQFDRAEPAGRVVEINWRATKIETADRVVITVPNGVLARAPISNFSGAVSYSRRRVVVNVPLNSPSGVAEILVAAARAVPGVLEAPRPDAIIAEFAESAVRYNVRYFISDHGRAAEIASGVLANSIAGLRRQNIFIPYPVRRVEITRNSEVATSREDLSRRALALESVSFIASLPEALREELVQKSYFVRYAKDENIVRQNDQGDALFVITHGQVRVEVDTGERVAHLAMLNSGDFFGEMSLLTGEPRAASIYAEQETELLVVGHNALRAAIDKDPSAVEGIGPAIAERQNKLSEQLMTAGSTYPREPVHQLTARIRSFFRN